MKATIAAPTLANAESSHVHHWRIEEANGPLSEGRCRVCGASKFFRNWLSETDFVTNEERRAEAEAA